MYNLLKATLKTVCNERENACNVCYRASDLRATYGRYLFRMIVMIKPPDVSREDLKFYP